ncbi:efflux RND transporter periplasmic adaptor subunit [Carboxylicivirga marina]|uniref:HlyD family efflux transporter periplasmic adaptor subunit n=1 Tax=Carboxylicivirga marina TaxID=2800988 RepID=A0ABS1HNV6_9BACT|nr:HlyD family efflux transporter periplasmic adaptor subunit [Carboxylicivirga marina]MBK3519135.1 HlyD family efflux transporter periplasmic adaptor subunit [Carboxylicivirga marina]
MNKKIAIVVACISILIIVIIWQPWKQESGSNKKAIVKRGLIETTVETTGELKAEKAVDITIPRIALNRMIDIWELKILSLVEEGKIVKKGDEVAKLDPTEVEERLRSTTDELNQYQTHLEDAKIDSSLTLSAQRETIQKKVDQLNDAKISVEQSTYESSAVQRQSQIELEKSERALAKAHRDLITKTIRHKTKISRNERSVKYYSEKKKLLELLRKELKIKSPSNGMVIYGSSYGRKVKVGSRVSRWRPQIATLPDLNSIISEMFVKEIDIAKIKVGQTVKISIDAFPKKIFNGQISSIANIGQEIPGEFQNGFKVNVTLDEYKEELLPRMTSSNTIITNSIEDVLYVDKKAVFSADSINFVLMNNGWSLVRKEVSIALETEEHFQIIEGLNENDEVLLNLPDNADEIELIQLN